MTVGRKTNWELWYSRSQCTRRLLDNRTNQADAAHEAIFSGGVPRALWQFDPCKRTSRTSIPTHTMMRDVADLFACSPCCPDAVVLFRQLVDACRASNARAQRRLQVLARFRHRLVCKVRLCDVRYRCFDVMMHCVTSGLANRGRRRMSKWFRLSSIPRNRVRRISTLIKEGVLFLSNLFFSFFFCQSVSYAHALLFAYAQSIESSL